MPALATSEFKQRIEPILGLAVIKAENGYGSALRFTLNDPGGNAFLNFWWDWRLEDAETILCGSSDTRSAIRAALEKVIGLTVVACIPEPFLQDLTVVFSNGWRLKSMALIAGDPQWLISLPDDIEISGRHGKVRLERYPVPDDYHPDPRAALLSDISFAAAKRWKTSGGTSDLGKCQNCLYFIRLDGPAAFLTYGGCANNESPHDGRLIHQNSGCAAFCPEVSAVPPQ